MQFFHLKTYLKSYLKPCLKTYLRTCLKICPKTCSKTCPKTCSKTCLTTRLSSVYFDKASVPLIVTACEIKKPLANLSVNKDSPTITVFLLLKP